MSDLLLQLVGTEEGITGLHVESLQKGGVPFEVVTAALSSGWQGLQEQHSKLAHIKAQVSMHVVPIKCVLCSGGLLAMTVIALQAAAPQAAIEHADELIQSRNSGWQWRRRKGHHICLCIYVSVSACVSARVSMSLWAVVTSLIAMCASMSHSCTKAVLVLSLWPQSRCLVLGVL